jgi:hypothetical protein
MWRDFTKALREIWRLSTPEGGTYRPDLHYMRGPGPKWHAKYGHLHPKAQPARAATRVALPGLADLAEHGA